MAICCEYAKNDKDGRPYFMVTCDSAAGTCKDLTALGWVNVAGFVVSDCAKPEECKKGLWGPDIGQKNGDEPPKKKEEPK